MYPTGVDSVVEPRPSQAPRISGPEDVSPSRPESRDIQVFPMIALLLNY